MRILCLKSFLISAAASAFMVAQAGAADAPSVDGLRPATYDWSGPYIGGYGSGVDTRSHYKYEHGGGTHDMNGWGYNGGVIAGWNYQRNNFVMGVEGTWGWGGRGAKNRENTEKTQLHYRDIATARARLGWAFDDTMVYATGGYAAYRTRFSSFDVPAGVSGKFTEHKWRQGWLVGGGVEHAFTDRILARMEYTYTHLNRKTYNFELDTAEGNYDVPIRHKFQGIHTMSIGAVYKFGW